MMSLLQHILPDHTNNRTMYIYKKTSPVGYSYARIVLFTVLAGLLAIIGLIILEYKVTVDGWVNEIPVLYKAKEIKLIDFRQKMNERNDNSESLQQINEKENDCYEIKKEVEDIENVLEVIDNVQYNNKDVQNMNSDTKIYIDKNYDNHLEDFGALEEIKDCNDNDNINNEIMKTFNINNFSDANEFLMITRIKSTLESNDNEVNEDDFEDFNTIFEVDEINNNFAQPLEEIDNEEFNEIINKIVNSEEDIDKLDEEPRSISMKFGIGIAIIVTAHFVFRK